LQFIKIVIEQFDIMEIGLVFSIQKNYRKRLVNSFSGFFVELCNRMFCDTT